MTPGLPDPAFWRGKRVLLTGHTGFKGSWAALWLAAMGAKVTGFALAPDQTPALFHLAGIERALAGSVIADIADRAALQRAVAAAQPDIVLHLAAQALVRRSLADPVATFATNALGTVHLLEAVRMSPARPSAILVVTTDKVYANDEAGRAFAEDDRLGGKDPYSASKAAAELVAVSYARSYFTPAGVALATARGGNVIGGGDFSADRLVPDFIRAIEADRPLVLRHPAATRPWQHVLDCLNGYFLYAEALAKGASLPPALNFGPDPSRPLSVGSVADRLYAAFGQASSWRHEPEPGSLEMQALAVDSARARAKLGWCDRLPGENAVQWTADWYAAHRAGRDMAAFTGNQIAAYAASEVDAS